ncbi:MAG: signal peptidase I [Leptospirales bacterium]|nr:signal peptidase I [Leptospirales bacterium]
MLTRLLISLFYLYTGWFFANESLRTPLSGTLTQELAWLLLATGAGLAALHWRLDHRLIQAGRGYFRWRWLERRIVALLAAALVAFHFRDMALERVEVSGESMAPGLQSGDRIWIEKISNGIHLPELSFPFGALSATGKLPRFGLQLMRRGDVVVFRYPGADAFGATFFVKRIVAMPGDHFELHGEDIWVNGVRSFEPSMIPSRNIQTSAIPAAAPIRQPPAELSLLAPVVRDSALFGIGNRGVVPPNCVLVLGDNRRHSRDSRSIGFIPAFFIVGRTF